MTHLSWVALRGMAHSFIELDKAVVHVIRLFSFLWLWFSDSALWRMIRGLWKLRGGRDWLRGKLGLALMGRAMLSKSLIQSSVDGGAVFPPCSLPGARPWWRWWRWWWPPAKDPRHALLHSGPPTLQQATTDPRLHWRLPDTHRQVRGSLLWGHCSFLLVLVHKGLLCPPRVYFLDLCKLWQLYGGLMVTSSKRAYAIPRSAAPRAYMPVADHCLPARPQETLRHSSVSVSVASLGPGAHEAWLSPLSVFGRSGVWF